MHAIKILKNKSVTISKPLKNNNLTVPRTGAPAMYRMGLQKIQSLFLHAESTSIIHRQQMHCRLILRWICVYLRAPAKINRKFAHLRWACDGPAKDFKTSDFSEISFLNPRLISRFAMDIGCLRLI